MTYGSANVRQLVGIDTFWLWNIGYKYTLGNSIGVVIFRNHILLANFLCPAKVPPYDFKRAGRNAANRPACRCNAQHASV